jgi:predicted HicB family RNase H-like nuclease
MPTRPVPIDRVPPDPETMMVQLNVKVPYHYREQLINEARDLKLSLNRHVVNGLVRVYPPQRR